MSDLIGKIVCGYKIISEVGEGGMGKVYLAESAFLTEYKQQVAVKTLVTFASTERQAALLRDLFAREANIQVQFKHPHIVGVIQFAVEDDRHFLILEYMPGYQHRGRRISNIADMIAYETGPIPHKRALKLFIHALDAMQYAHSFKYRWDGEERIGIVHRDIKPGNLLLLDYETIKVSDFGIVKVQQRNRGMTRKLTPGTSAYMSPEAVLGPQNFGLSELDARSDIYALGMTLYEMLAGRLPFAPDPDTNPDVSLRRKQVDEMPPPPSTFYPAIPKALDDLVLRALQKKPEDRYQTADEFKRAITALDAQLEIGLREGAPTMTFETRPFALPTEHLSATTTAGATTTLAPHDTHHPAAHPTEASQTSVAPATIPVAAKSGSSKMILGIGALALALIAVVSFWLWRNHEDGKNGQANIVAPTSNTVSNGDPKKNDITASLPEGMILIPQGSFMMGRDLSPAEKNFEVGSGGQRIKIFSYDYPAHAVTVAPFYLDQTEVTNAQYAAFIKATSHKSPSVKGWNGAQAPPNADLVPVTGVSYEDAADYCKWLSTARKNGLNYRLPTEAEWEYAARGKDAGKPGSPVNFYPWGDQWIEGAANTKESHLDHARIVGQYQTTKSPFGVLDLAGNVAEWTSTDFSHYPGSDQQTPREKDYVGNYQVVRGGGFAYPKEYAMTTTRVWARPDDRGEKLGFRCAAGK